MNKITLLSRFTQLNKDLKEWMVEISVFIFFWVFAAVVIYILCLYLLSLNKHFLKTILGYVAG